MVRVRGPVSILCHLLALVLTIQVAFPVVPAEWHQQGPRRSAASAALERDHPSGSSRSSALNFSELALDFQQDNLKTDTLIRVVNDTNGVNETTRAMLHSLISEQVSQLSGGSKRREIIYMDTIFTKKWVRELEGKMNVSYQGESKSDPAIRWEILYNDTTILVVRSASKYYYWTHVQSVASFIILCMIVGGNLSILHRLKSCRRRRSNVNYFIVQLAIADLLVGIFSVTLDSGLRIQKVFRWSLFACRASKYIPALFIYSSTYLLVALSVDRWEAVVKPLAFTRNRSRGHHLVVASWLLAAVSALPVIFFTTIKDIDGLPQCWIHLGNYGWRVYMLYLTSLLLILPTLIIAICYIHIVYTIWSKGRLVASSQLNLNNNSSNSNNNCEQQRHKAGQRQLSSSFYGARSPDSVDQELSTSTTRLNQNRVSQTSQRSSKFRFSSRRVSWNEAADQRQPPPTTTTSCHRREQSLDEPGRMSSARLAEEAAREGAGEPPPMSSNIDGGSGRRPETSEHQTGPSLGEMPAKNYHLECNQHEPCSGAANWKRDNECRDQASGGARSARDCAQVGGELPCRESAATSPKLETSADLTRTKEEPNKGQPVQTTTIEPEAPQSSGGRRRRPKLTSQVASQGLRMLSFVRSQSAASPFSGSPSSSDSSSSLLALRIRPVGVAEATTTTALATDRHAMRPECPSASAPAAAAGANRQDIAIDDPARLRVIARDDTQVVVVPGGSTCDRSLTAASDVGEAAEGGAERRRRAWPVGQSAASVAESCASATFRAGPQTNSGLAGNGGHRRNPLDGLRRSQGHEMGAKRISSTGAASEAEEHCDSHKTTRDVGIESARGVAEELHDNNLQISHSRRSSTGIDARSVSSTAKEVSVWGLVAAAATTFATRRDSQKSPLEGTSGRLAATPPGGGKRDLEFVAQQHGSGVIPKARIKTIKMTLVIVVAYILCWTPFLVLNLCVVFGTFENRTHFSHALLTLSQSLAHLNSAVNPIIFWLFSSKRGGGGGGGGGGGQLAGANKTRHISRPACDSFRDNLTSGRSRTKILSYGNNKT